MIDTTTPTGKLLFHVTSAFAEFERDMIVQRVNAGLDRARAKGVTLGRPRIDEKTEAAIRKAVAKGGKGKHKIAAELGVGSGTVARIKAEMLAGSSRGGVWHPVTVARGSRQAGEVRTMAIDEKSIRGKSGHGRTRADTVVVIKPGARLRALNQATPPRATPSNIGRTERCEQSPRGAVAANTRRSKEFPFPFPLPKPGEPLWAEYAAWVRDPEWSELYKTWEEADREKLERTVIENAKQLQASGIDTAVPGHEFQLTRAHFEVSLVGRPWVHRPKGAEHVHPKATESLGKGLRCSR